MTKYLMFLIAMTALFGGAARLLAQDVPPILTLDAALAGNVAPLTLTFGEMREGWRRVTFEQNSDLPSRRRLANYGITIQPAVYYTKGLTATCGDETYLIAYRRKDQVIDLQALTERYRRRYEYDEYDMSEEPEPSAPSEETELNLCLLNLRASGNMTSAKPFSLQQEIEAYNAGMAAVLKAKRERSCINLRQIATGVLMYVQDYDETFPAVQTPTEVHRMLLEYTDAQQITSPVTKERYEPNMRLAGKALEKIQNPSEVVMFYEKTAGPDGKRCAAFVDGHAEVVDKERWEYYKGKSGIQ